MADPTPLDTGLIKALFARLVKAHGSQDAAAARLEVTRQRISQLCSASDDHAKDVPTWGQVWMLEQACERSVVFASLGQSDRAGQPRRTRVSGERDARPGRGSGGDVFALGRA